MGLFSNKTSYKVNVTVSKIFNDSDIPNSAANGTIKAILQDGDMQQYLMEELVNSIGVRASSGWNWARDNYSIGLPKADVKNYLSAENLVKQAIQANIGRTVTFDYYRMAPVNSMHFGWQHCYNTLGYNPSNNELVGISNQVGKPCYLVDMVATYKKTDYDWMVETSDMGVMDQLGPSPASGYRPSAPYNLLGTIGKYAEQPPYVVSSVATENYLTITYEFEQSPGIFTVRGFTVTIDALEELSDYHQARYVDSAGVTGFFTYKQNSGTYPLVDAAFKLAYNGLGTYYPWTYYRINGQIAVSALPDKVVTEMTKWGSYVGIDYDNMLENVHKDTDVDDVEQVIMLLGCDPGGKSPAEMEYMFKHMDALHANAMPQTGLAPGLAESMNAYTTSPSQFQRIQDSKFTMNFQFSGINKVRRVGKVGKPGQYLGALKEVAQNAQVFASQDGGGMSQGKAVPTQKAYVYQHQVNDTVYDEIAVYNLRMDYEVHRKKGYAAGPGSKQLMIPVDHTIAETMGVRAREELICHSLRLMVNTVVKVTQPWYASGAFRILLLVVAVVITILSMGAAWQSIVAAAALGAGALAITVLVIVLQTVLVRVAVRMFIQAVGPKLGLVAAIAAIVVGSYAVSTDAAWGESLVAVGNNMVTESNEAYGSMVEDVMQDIAEFNEWASGMFDTLNEKRELLGLNGQLAGLDPIDLTYNVPRITLGETPSDFYARTVHSGNIGVASFDMVEYYHTTALTLPVLSQTEENFSDGESTF